MSRNFCDERDTNKLHLVRLNMFRKNVKSIKVVAIRYVLKSSQCNKTRFWPRTSLGELTTLPPRHQVSCGGILPPPPPFDAYGTSVLRPLLEKFLATPRPIWFVPML